MYSMYSGRNVSFRAKKIPTAVGLSGRRRRVCETLFHILLNSLSFTINPWYSLKHPSCSNQLDKFAIRCSVGKFCPNWILDEFLPPWIYYEYAYLLHLYHDQTVATFHQLRATPFRYLNELYALLPYLVGTRLYYPNKSEWVPVSVRISISSISRCSQTSSQSDWIWHSHKPFHSPDNLCGLYWDGNVPVSASRVITSSNKALS